MPKEMISASHDGQTFRAVIGWHRDQGVQLGIQVADEQHTLLDVLYGDNLRSLEAVGDALYRWHATELDDLDATLGDRSACQEAGAMVLEWVEASRVKQERDGIWTDMSRYGINELVRLLRKARDTAYGRDE